MRLLQRTLLALSLGAVQVLSVRLLDDQGRLTVPSHLSANNLVGVVTSPTDSNPLSLDESSNILSCPGCTLESEDSAPLALVGSVAAAVVVPDVTVGDVAAGLLTSRHARTLAALFAGHVGQDTNKQTLIVSVTGDLSSTKQVLKDLQSLYQAACATVPGSTPSFAEAYTVHIVSSESEALQIANEAAQAAPTTDDSLAAILSNARAPPPPTDPAHLSHASVAVGTAYSKQARAVRAKLTSWKGRTARGLWLDGFGSQAEGLLQRTSGTFEKETLAAAGLVRVGEYRAQQGRALRNMVQDAIRQVYNAQVTNLQKACLKRFQAALLKNLQKESAETIGEANAATLRKELFAFETVIDDLQVPSLGLVTDTREMQAKLTDALTAFPDSPAAQIQRMNKIQKVVQKEKKPGEKGIDFGLDLVAVLRPDGFGTLQGYAGYQMGGNSVTFGIHNDADDPQTIAQFGGVRPPLLRIQPKVRVDVEM